MLNNVCQAECTCAVGELGFSGTTLVFGDPDGLQRKNKPVTVREG